MDTKRNTLRGSWLKVGRENQTSEKFTFSHYLGYFIYMRLRAETLFWFLPWMMQLWPLKKSYPNWYMLMICLREIKHQSKSWSFLLSSIQEATLYKLFWLKWVYICLVVLENMHYHDMMVGVQWLWNCSGSSVIQFVTWSAVLHTGYCRTFNHHLHETLWPRKTMLVRRINSVWWFPEYMGITNFSFFFLCNFIVIHMNISIFSCHGNHLIIIYMTEWCSILHFWIGSDEKQWNTYLG